MLRGFVYFDSWLIDWNAVQPLRPVCYCQACDWWGGANECCSITINSGTLLIDGYGVLTCVSWNYHLDDVIHESATATTGNQSSSPVSTTTTTMLTPTTSVWQQMVVTTFSNGCRPRYSCVQLIKRAPSVLHYRLSQTEVSRHCKRDKRRRNNWNTIQNILSRTLALGSIFLQFRSHVYRVPTFTDKKSRTFQDPHE